MSEVVDSSLKSAVKGITLILLGSVASLLLWFATKVLIVRSTTKEEFGIYSLALAVVSIVSVLATLGLQEGSTRFISIFLGEGRKEKAADASHSALRMSLISGTFCFLFLFFFAGPVAGHVFYMPELATPLRVISLFVPFFIMSRVIGSVLRAYNIIRPKVYYLDVGQPLFFLAFLGAFMLLELPFISVLYAYLFSAIMVFISISSYGYSKQGLNPVSLKGDGQSVELLKFSIPLVLGGVASMVLVWTDTFMLGRYAGPNEVGVYNISISLARLLQFALGAVGFVFMPLAGEMYAKAQHVELKRAYQVLTKWVFSATLPLFFILFFFPEMTITFLFGERYVVSSGSLRILSLGFLFHVFMGVNVMMLTVLGLSKAIMNISVFGAGVNIALNYVLIKMLGMGITGAAIATAVSYAVLNSAISITVYRESGIHPLTARYLRPIAGSVVIALVIYAMAKSLPLHIWLMPLYFVLFIGGYVFSLLMTRSLEREDLELFENVLRRTGLRLQLLMGLLKRFVH